MEEKEEKKEKIRVDRDEPKCIRIFARISERFQIGQSRTVGTGLK